MWDLLRIYASYMTFTMILPSHVDSHLSVYLFFSYLRCAGCWVIYTKLHPARELLSSSALIITRQFDAIPSIGEKTLCPHFSAWVHSFMIPRNSTRSIPLLSDILRPYIFPIFSRSAYIPDLLSRFTVMSTVSCLIFHNI